MAGIKVAVLALLLAPACAATGPDPETEPQPDAGPEPEPEPEPENPTDSPASLRLMTFNIKHAELSSLEAIAEVINASKPDVVALQEVDRDAERSGVVFQSYRLGQLTGMASSYRAALELADGGTYGLAILSRFPILSSDKLNLTSTGEQRVLAVWHLELDDGRILSAGNTHLATSADERAVQIEEVVDDIASRELAVVMGDFNEQPDGPVYAAATAELTDGWDSPDAGHTFPASAPDRRIDYVFLGGDWPAASRAAVYDTTASDHRPVVVTVPLP